MAPVVAKPSSVANPAAAAFRLLPRESRQTPAGSSLPPANVQAASGVSLPPTGSRSRSMGSGTSPRPASSCTCVAIGAMLKVVMTASSCCGKTWFTPRKAAR